MRWQRRGQESEPIGEVPLEQLEILDGDDPAIGGRSGDRSSQAASPREAPYAAASDADPSSAAGLWSAIEHL